MSRSQLQLRLLLVDQCPWKSWLLWNLPHHEVLWSWLWCRRRQHIQTKTTLLVRIHEGRWVASSNHRVQPRANKHWRVCWQGSNHLKAQRPRLHRGLQVSLCLRAVGSAICWGWTENSDQSCQLKPQVQNSVLLHCSPLHPWEMNFTSLRNPWRLSLENLQRILRMETRRESHIARRAKSISEVSRSIVLLGNMTWDQWVSRWSCPWCCRLQMLLHYLSIRSHDWVQETDECKGGL